MVLTVAAIVGTVTITDVYNGASKLTKNTHYTVSSGVVTLLDDYLATLTEGVQTIKFVTNQGEATAKVNVVDTTDVG